MTGSQPKIYPCSVSKRWSIVSEQDAIAQAGPDAEIIEGDFVTYALGAKALVIIVDAGDRPDGNTVESAREITLRQPFPGKSAEWVIAEKPSAAPFLAFVRLPHGCMELGVMSRTGGLYGPARRDSITDTWRKGLPQRVHLEIDGRIPPKLLAQVRATRDVPLASIAWLSQLPDDRTGALRSFVSEWYADLPAASGKATTAPMPLPPGLTAFYELAADRQEILGKQDFVLPPNDLEYVDDEQPLTVVATENQGVWEALIDPNDNDPTVWYDDGDQRVPEREPLSGFLIQFVLSEAATASPFLAQANTAAQKAKRFTDQLTRVPLQARRIPEDPALLYVAPGLAALTAPDLEGGTNIFVGARQRSALKPLRHPGFAWDVYDG